MLDHVAGRRVRRCVFAALAVVAAVLSVAVAPPAARAAGAEVSSWADALSALKGSADPVTYTVSSDTVPGETLTVPAGRTLVVKGSGSLAGGTTGASLFKVEKGGTLVLDGVAVSGNKVGEQGAVNVVAGGKLELGFADGQGATAPSITGNTKDGTVACNLVARSDSTIRLNAPASRRIGLSYASTVESPVALVESGARTVQASDVADGAIGPDNSDQLMVATNGHVVLRNPAKMLHWAPDSSWGGGSDHTSVISTLFTEAGCSSITKISGTTSSRKTFVGDSALNGLSLNQYDFIYIEPSKLSVSGGVYGHYSDAEISALASFLDSGGRIFIQAENTNFGPLNASAQELANALNAVFTIETSPMINGNIFSDKSSVVGSTLTEGLTDELNLPAASPLTYDPNRANAVLKTLDGGKEYTWCVDMQAGSTADGTPYGNITLITDINCWKYYPAWAAQFAGNLLSSSVENRNIAATGVSPNDRYEIVFDSLGGSEVDSQTLLVGAVVSKPEDPTRDGYDFAGWATDRAGEDEYDFATPVSGAMTLYAKWNPHTYVVDFNANAQNVKQEAYSQEFSYGTAQE